MSFPADHRAKIGSDTAREAIQSADVVLVLDADVPWIPSQVIPSMEATIFHIDIDPRKEAIQSFDIGATHTFEAECHLALTDIVDHIQQSELYDTLKEEFRQRYDVLKENKKARLCNLAMKAELNDDDPVTAHYLFAMLRNHLPDGTIFLSDAVTNQPIMAEQLQLKTPGTNFTKGGSGLGWAASAAIGASLALRKYDTSQRPEADLLKSRVKKFICCVTGDGASFMARSIPAYYSAADLETPFLTIIVNNGGWNATQSCLKHVHPDGQAARMTNAELGIDVSADGPDWVMAHTSASTKEGHMWGTKVRTARSLVQGLAEAIRVVEGGGGATLDVVVAKAS